MGRLGSAYFGPIGNGLQLERELLRGFLADATGQRGVPRVADSRVRVGLQVRLSERRQLP
jgi:hypothetical protein